MKQLSEVTKTTSIDEILAFIESLPSAVKYFNPERNIAESWDIDDVKSRLVDREAGEELSDKECLDVLHEIDRNHDANVGISWDVMDFYIDQIISGGE